MGVTYKLREEVVHFIISQRQSNPLASCRQLAESASQKFDLHLSKSSIHDVLKESGITTPRGRKPKDKFEIPQEKKDQIQASLSQVKLSPPLVEDRQAKVILIADIVESKQEPLGAEAHKSLVPHAEHSGPSVILSEGPHAGHSQVAPKDLNKINSIGDSSAAPQNDKESSQNDREISPEYDGAGTIFLKAALWDLGVFSEENIKPRDWNYYLTYSKGIKVVLENNNSFFIDLPLPLERCIREVADGLINNIKPFIVHKVSDEELFKACMDAQPGFKIDSILIVDDKDHVLLELNNIVEFNRKFMLQKRVFVENNKISLTERAKAIFFPQIVDNNEVMENILNLKGFNTTNKDENVVTLLIGDGYKNKDILQEAAEKLNGMYLRDEQDRIVSVSLRGAEGDVAIS